VPLNLYGWPLTDMYCCDTPDVGQATEVTQYEALVDLILERPGPVRLVAVDGPGGAGKSTFAARLEAAAADRAFVVHTDDFASAEEPINWWPRLKSSVIEPIVDGRTGRFRRYDWNQRALAEWIVVPRRPIVIIEGVSSSRLEWHNHLAFVVWMETAPDARLGRGLERDGDDMLDQWMEWMAAEDRHFDRDGARGRADLLVDGNPELPHDAKTEFVALPSDRPRDGRT
tara:strand:- start:1423 stop:2106 length:684 start_codon:yes stop_codon:yes gene_type:complete